MEEHTPSYNEYVSLWQDQMEVITDGAAVRVATKAPCRLPNLKDVQFSPEKLANGGHGFDYWTKNRMPLWPINKTASVQAKHVFEVMMAAGTACQLHPKKFSTDGDTFDDPSNFEQRGTVAGRWSTQLPLPGGHG
jgi:hypothetical protein